MALALLIVITIFFPGPQVDELGKFGGTGNKPGLFKTPSAIAVDDRGTVYVCDRGNHRIQLFSLKGEYLRDIGGFGFAEDQFDEPADLWARATLNFFVADYNNQRVQRFDKDLNHLSSRYSNSGENERFQFREVLSIAFSSQGDMFILDGGENKIIKINARNEAEVAFGYYESGTGELTAPVQVDITAGRNVIVSDATAGAVFVYDYFGNFQYAIEHPDMISPAGLATDLKSRIYVCDPEARTLFVFSQNGRLVYRLDNVEGLPLKQPLDAAIVESPGKTVMYLLDGDEVLILNISENGLKE